MTEWGIARLHRTDGAKVVMLVDWFCKMQDGGSPEVEYGVVEFAEKNPSDADFIPFDDLTEQQVLAWVHQIVDKAAIESRLKAQIEAQKTPVLVSELPWQVPTGD
jgi:hypothetical protein